MAIYLESFLDEHPDAVYLFTPDDNKKAPERLKDQYTGKLKRYIWTHPDFVSLAPADSVVGDIASHSGRKCPAEYAANCGAATNAVEIRGRWKGQKGGRVVFRYINVQQLYEDAEVAGILCLGGPVMYVVKEGLTQITTPWLHEHVVPNIARRFATDRRFIRVMALPLLFICMSEIERVHVPPAIRQRVRDAYSALGVEVEQPVRKIPLLIDRGMGGVLRIDPVDLPPDEPAPGMPVTEAPAQGVVASGVRRRARMANDVSESLLVRMNRLENSFSQSTVSTATQLTEMRCHMTSQFRVVNANLRGFGGTIQGALVRQAMNGTPRNPPVPRAAATAAAAAADSAQDSAPPTLVNNPRTVMELWREFKFGINGRKAAERWTRKERNQDRRTKQKYWRRNHVWHVLDHLVRGGRTAERAVLELRRVYGFKSSVSKVIEALVKDKKRFPGGIHPNLA